jgi:5-methylcytosine-specific restriction enzyme A
MKLATLGSRVVTLDLRTVAPAPKRADSIYSTPQFKAWRAIVINRAHRRCQAPGCGRREARMFADHIVELSDDGAPFDPANGQCLCGSCHTRKTHAARLQRQGGVNLHDPGGAPTAPAPTRRFF